MPRLDKNEWVGVEVGGGRGCCTGLDNGRSWGVAPGNMDGKKVRGQRSTANLSLGASWHKKGSRSVRDSYLISIINVSFERWKFLLCSG